VRTYGLLNFLTDFWIRVCWVWMEWKKYYISKCLIPSFRLSNSNAYIHHWVRGRHGYIVDNTNAKRTKQREKGKGLTDYYQEVNALVCSLSTEIIGIFNRVLFRIWTHFRQ
jgi:hypothetical protein